LTEITKDHQKIFTKDLTKIYGIGIKTVKAVIKANISVNSGVHGFLGINGAGKTTTMLMLIGGISITFGTAKIKGFKVGTKNAKRLIGFLPQDPTFYENKTGYRYLLYMARLGGKTRIDAILKTNELIKLMGLEDAKNRKIEKYSGGMKQKIGIAAALIHEPEILLLDEPTANLDPLGRVDLIEKIKNLSKEKTIFVSSHILSEIEQMCDNVTIIHKGKVIMSDTIKNIKKMHSQLQNQFVLDTNSNEKMLQVLKRQEFIRNTWIDNENKKIKIITRSPEELQANILKLFSEANVLLKEFSQQESSFQDTFIKIIEGENKNNEHDKKSIK